MVTLRDRWAMVPAVAAVLAVIALCCLAAYGLQAYRDWAFICTNTGSRKGHREWFFGSETDQWYRQSALERFMRSKHPDDLRHQWVSYAGTGKNIFSMALLYGHGRPGPITLIRPELLDEHIGSLTDAEKRSLYDLLVSGDPDEIKKKIEQIVDDAARREIQPVNGSK